MKILVLGGYGNFGARIVRALAREPGVCLLSGGRHIAKANALACATGAAVQGVGIDTEAPDFADRLQQLAPDLVIHTAGPFQGQDYRVALAVAAARAHYLDLADGRRFVCDFAAANHAAFERVGRTAVTGASSVPALSSAVVDHLVAGWQRVDRIDTCIAPAQSAPRGAATLAGVLAYCGEPLRVLIDGRWVERHGWADPTHVRFARLKPRQGALCDVPDLELFATRYAGVKTVLFRAALEVGLAQQAFSVLATLRSKGLIPAPEKLAPWMHAAGKLLDPLGSALGGMVVRVEGLDAQGSLVRRAWHVTADHDHGPEIPCMAAILLARKLVRGETLPAGAQPCMGLLTLADFEPEFARWRMSTDLVAA